MKTALLELCPPCVDPRDGPAGPKSGPGAGEARGRESRGCDDPGPTVGSWRGRCWSRPAWISNVIRVRPGRGPASATLDVPDQAAGHPGLTRLVVEGDSVTIGVKLIAAGLPGDPRRPRRPHLAGKWKQGPTTLPLGFRKVEVVAGQQTAPEPSAPVPLPGPRGDLSEPGPGVTLAGDADPARGKGAVPGGGAGHRVGAAGPRRDPAGPQAVLAPGRHPDPPRGPPSLRGADDRGFGRFTGSSRRRPGPTSPTTPRGVLRTSRGSSEVDPRRSGSWATAKGGWSGRWSRRGPPATWRSSSCWPAPASPATAWRDAAGDHPHLGRRGHRGGYRRHRPDCSRPSPIVRAKLNRRPLDDEAQGRGRRRG